MDNIIDKVKIGENIRKIRHSNGFSQTIFAEKLGVKYQTISQIEKGQIAPSIEILLKISSNFRISIESLLLQNEIPNNTTQVQNFYPELLTENTQLKAQIQLLESHNKELNSHIEDLRSTNQYFQKILDKATVVEAVKEDLSLQKSKVNA